MNPTQLFLPLILCTLPAQAVTPPQADFYEQNTRWVTHINQHLRKCHSLRICTRVVRGKDEGATTITELHPDEQTRWRQIIPTLRPLKTKGSMMKLPRKLSYLEMLDDHGCVFVCYPLYFFVNESELPNGSYDSKATMYIPGQ